MSEWVPAVSFALTDAERASLAGTLLRFLSSKTGDYVNLTPRSLTLDARVEITPEEYAVLARVDDRLNAE